MPRPRSKLKMLEPRLQMTPTPFEKHGFKMVEDLPRPPTRWTKASNGRLLPLNSRAWQKLRCSVLAEVPLCQYCPPSVITPAD